MQGSGGQQYGALPPGYSYGMLPAQDPSPPPGGMLPPQQALGGSMPSAGYGTRSAGAASGFTGAPSRLAVPFLTLLLCDSQFLVLVRHCQRCGVNQ